MHFRSLYCTAWHRSNTFRLVSENPGTILRNNFTRTTGGK